MTTIDIDRGERLHGLDALRGGALLLGVVLHGAMSFFPDQIWIVADDQRSPWASGLFFFIHLFRMATFFLIAGLFAHAMVERRGLGRFVVDRLVRIAAPLVVFWPLVMAGIIAVLIWIGARMNMSAADAPPPPAFTVASFPLTHLWFLWVLLFLYAGFVILRLAASVLGRGASFGRVLDPVTAGLVGPWGAFILGAPVALALWLQPNWLAFFGVPTPDTGLVPNTPALVAFGLAFGFGALLDRRRDLLERIKSWTPAFLGLALAAGATAMAVVGGPTPQLTPLTDPQAKAMAAAAFGVGVYASVFAAVGVSLILFSGSSRVRRYLADASYWIYIVHLPLVMAAQVWVQHLALPWALKLTLVVAGVSAVSLISYELLIRHSFMGWWLNGRRIPWRRRPTPVLAPAE